MTLLERVTWHIAPIAISASLLYAVNLVEAQYFPVVDHFYVTKVQTSDEGILVQGTMKKIRDCTFIQLTAHIDNTPVEIEFLDSKTPTTRIIGYQFWGPWNIHSDKAKSIQIHARHQCHPLWQQSQKLASLSFP